MIVKTEESNVDEHTNRGSIVRIKLENFMTYDDLEVKPGSRLNMILGPNGTGKSSIVCCIIVGLAGEVSLTGRGGSPADFVKKGRDYCVTEIELYNDRANNYVIQRKICITDRSQAKLDHKSEWKINNKNVKKAEVQELTRKLNIKVDNLCQFLPQDSVTQFVKMNTCELLLNTLKAAGDDSLVDNHTRLVDLTKEIDSMRFNLENLEKSCKENEINAKRLESEVIQFREKEQLIKLKAICAEKIHYARYEEGKIQCDKSKADLNKLKDDLVALEEASQPYKNVVDSYYQDVTKYKKSIDRSNDEVSKITQSISNAQNKIDSSKSAYQSEFATFKSKLDQENQREKTLTLKHQELKSYQDKYTEAKSIDLTKQMKSIEKRIDEIKDERIQCNQSKNSIDERLNKVVREIDELRNEADLIIEIKRKKANLLRAKNADAYTIMDWLLKNKEKFEKQVFTPMMCEINVKDPKFARYVENSIPRNELTAFVCQTVADVKTLTRSVMEFLKLKVNVILVPDKTMQEFEQESAQLPNVRNLGVKHYLKDLIEAPEPIMRYLCGSNNFHRIPVIEKCSENDLNNLLKIVPRLYANEEFYTSNRSRYDQQLITLRDHVRDAQHLIYSLDRQRINETKIKFQKLQEDREQLNNERKLITERDDLLKREWQERVETHKEYKSRHDQKRKLEALIKSTKKDIDELENQTLDIEAERRTLQSSIKRINIEIMNNLADLVEAQKELVAFKRIHILNLLLHKLAERNHKVANRKYRESMVRKKRLEVDIKKAQDAHKIFEAALQTLVKNAEDKISGFRNCKLDSKTKRRFDKVEQKTVEELTNKIDDLNIRIERIYNNSNNSVVLEYNRQTDELKDKRLKIDDLISSISALESSRKCIKETWLPSVKEVIDVINTNYGKFMRKLCYDGQVKLDFNETQPENFSAYGISILVRYRDDEHLIPLSATRQSGGERSVATMIYMLALQTKTTAPFRCVDEINQGMDKDNERKVFELLVQTADSSSSQYFLVSPKLLSDLPYSEKMVIHMTYNGPLSEVNWHKHTI